MMQDKVRKTIEKYRFFTGAINVIAALSGGADSMALFHFLHNCAGELGIVLAAAHFNHGLRGEEADRDEAFVRDVCRRYGVPLYVERVDMAGMQRPVGQGTEEWARQLRYSFFERLISQHSALVATAHTASDNAETVLFHAVRGTGPKGLGGIPPVRGAFVRPLLEVDRGEVEEYCKANGLAYVTDGTNADVCYARNRIRLNVMPELKMVHAGAEAALGRLAADMREVDLFLQEQAATLLEKARRADGFDSFVLLQAPQPVRLSALAQLAGPVASRNTLQQMERVLRGEVAAAQLPGQLVAKQKEGAFLVCPWQAPAVPPVYEEPLREGEILLPGGYRLLVEVADVGAHTEFCKKKSENHFTFMANCDKIVKNSVLRPRKQGDLFAPKGRGVTKTLKKWMNEQKIDRETRAAMPLLCDGHRVLWVWNEGFCEGVSVDADTKKVLYIRQI